MILLTNTASQTVAVGAAVTYDTTILHTGNAECHRRSSGNVGTRALGVYEVQFSANVTGTVPVELAISLDGEELPETLMISNVAGLQNVSAMTAFRTCCGEGRVSVVNTGAAAATVQNPKLFVRRIA